MLRHDEVLSDNSCTTYADKLGLTGVYPQPYFRKRDRETRNVLYEPGHVYGYIRKNEYQGYTVGELDPFSRFSFGTMTKEELFFERWFVDDDEASSDGVLFEAILACHALAHEACHDCKYRKTLRWNGGGDSSWQDLICMWYIFTV